MKRKKVIALIIGVCAIAAVGTVVYVNTSDKTPSKKTETTTEKDNTNDKTDDILETFMQPDYATEYVSVPEYKSVEYQYDPVTTSDDDVTNQIRYNMMTYTMIRFQVLKIQFLKMHVYHFQLLVQMIQIMHLKM